ncbi:MAG: GNAT family N-acetyltransferase, partial [Actinobacteria bacterium]|nr:GNAT family N-acetyltransferase [Actinomycetota bacterium]
IEISGVCTDPEYRGRGLARMLMEQVAAGIRQRGCRPFLHVMAGNTGAIRLYESMGYVIRRALDVNAYRPG